ncbi:acetyl-CoA C-acetyltransferase [Raineyella antarctica]|uniref:Probable acetyl-CoA acetyltransferase n=1 Tax=Raineyella antarctica TaxID=1577474 RepID=A0A1G6HHS3_9ACTN|nr:thiolase family protein [Raineyella antarctica]SDB93790.1 acetyl-CoA C-acetyltransferase [Raineyella antarctica]
MINNAVIIDAVRSPLAHNGGALAAVHPADLAAPVIRHLYDACPQPELLRDVVLGHAFGRVGLGRDALTAAGIPVEVPAMSLERGRASGLSAIDYAADKLVAVNNPGYAIAGGVESGSLADAPLNPSMADAANVIAEEYHISREQRQAYLARSHERFAAARAKGMFDAEIVPVAGVSADDPVEAGTDLSVVDDGAAAVLLVDGATHRRARRPGLRVTASATFGCDPSRVGWSIIPAIEKVLYSTRLKLEQFDVIEFDEAYAANVLAACSALRIDDSRVCRQGGALALGHPWGASGAVVMARLFTQLVRQDGGRFGLAAVSAGSGQGIAMVVERC